MMAALVACAPKVEPTQAPVEAATPAGEKITPVKVVFLITQPLSPFEEDIWTWVQKSQTEGYASEVKLIEMKNPTEYEQTFRQVSEQGFNVVISTFFFVHEAFNKVAPDFPDTHYVMVYEPNDANIPNIHGILYDVHEGSYICGVVAGMMTKTKQVGWFGGDNSPGIVKFLAGFEAGLKSVSPDIKLDIQFAGSFVDPDKGYEIATAFYEKGDDIVMHAANKTGLGLFKAAKEKGKYAVGVDMDQSGEAPENVICSALTNPGQSIYPDIVNTANGTWKGGTTYWGIDDGAQAAALTNLVPADVKAAAEQAQKDIAEGKIKVPDTTTSQ
jgi:basic membrane protein A